MLPPAPAAAGSTPQPRAAAATHAGGPGAAATAPVSARSQPAGRPLRRDSHSNLIPDCGQPFDGSGALTAGARVHRRLRNAAGAVVARDGRSARVVTLQGQTHAGPHASGGGLAGRITCGIPRRRSSLQGHVSIAPRVAYDARRTRTSDNAGSLRAVTLRAWALGNGEERPGPRACGHQRSAGAAVALRDEDRAAFTSSRDVRLVVWPLWSRTSTCGDTVRGREARSRGKGWAQATQARCRR